jgi:hypothetical protein
VTIFGFLKFVLIAALGSSANRLPWPVVSDSRSGVTKGRLTAVVRGVGHRKGGKQLLNTSAGLVRTVVGNELIVHGAAPSSGSQRN